MSASSRIWSTCLSR